MKDTRNNPDGWKDYARRRPSTKYVFTLEDWITIFVMVVVASFIAGVLKALIF